MATTAPRLLGTLASKTWCNFGDMLLLHRSSCCLGARLMELFLHKICGDVAPLLCEAASRWQESVVAISIRFSATEAQKHETAQETLYITL